MSFNNLYREYLAEEERRSHPMRRTQREMQLVNQLNKLANQYALWHRRGGSHLGNSAAMWQNYQKAMNRWWRQATEENHRRLPSFLARNLKAHHAAVERNKRLRSAPTLKRLAWNAAGLKGVTPQQLRVLSKLPGVYSQLNRFHPQKPSTRRSLSQPPRRARSSRAASAPR
jgi:hypothetical protein